MYRLFFIIPVAAIAIVAFLIFGGKDYGNGRQTQETVPPNTIFMETDGFRPNQLSVKVGDTVNFVNKDTEEHWPASNDHPTHQLYSSFNPRRPIKVDETWSFTFDKAGTWGCHDHLYPNFHCTITVHP